MILDHSIEARLLQYIADHGLHDDQSLPGDSELRTLLDCTGDELKAVLLDIENHGIIKPHDWGWTVVSLPKIDDKDAFSLSRTALLQGHRLENKVAEKAIRLPLEEAGPLTSLEKKIQKLLGLAESEPFIILVRVRTLSDVASDSPTTAIHRVYLRPDRFPSDFLDRQDFEHESLVHLYRQHGYKLISRDVSLQAKLANLHEKNMFNIPPYQPILHVEQQLHAEDASGQKILLEYLQASCLNWSYEIKGLPSA